MTSINTVEKAITEIKSEMANGVRGITAVRNVEQRFLREFRAERNELLDKMAYQVTVSARQKDKSRLMKLFHGARHVLEANAEHINGELSTLSAGVSTPRFTWSPKDQSPLVVRVNLGEKSGMTGEAGYETEFKGFKGEEIVTFFMAQQKDYWARRSGFMLLRELMAELEVATYKEVWSSVGRIATGAALCKEYVTFDSRGEPSTERMGKMKESIWRRENDVSYGCTNHYVEQSAEELREYIAKVESWVEAADKWKGKIGKIVGEYNAIMEWAGEEIRLPTGELQAMHEWQRKATVDGMTSAAEETADFRANLAASKAEANKKFAELLG